MADALVATLSGTPAIFGAHLRQCWTGAVGHGCVARPANWP